GEPPAGGGDHPPEDVQELGFVAERDIGRLHLPAFFHEHLPRAVDHDVGNRVVAYQPFQRAESEDLIQDLLDQGILFGRLQQHRLPTRQLLRQSGELPPQLLFGQALVPTRSNRPAQLLVKLLLETGAPLVAGVFPGGFSMSRCHDPVPYLRRALRVRRRSPLDSSSYKKGTSSSEKSAGLAQFVWVPAPFPGNGTCLSATF